MEVEQRAGGIMYHVTCTGFVALMLNDDHLMLKTLSCKHFRPAAAEEMFQPSLLI